MAAGKSAVVTAGQIVTQHPESGERHVSCCPLSIRGQETLGVHWTAQDVAYSHFRGYAAENRQMPMAVVLGGDPLLRLLASFPLPKQTDAYLLAGFLRERNVELVKARTLELAVPACADLVIEGRIDTEAPPEPSRPIALDTGFYSGEQEVSLMHATAVTHRSNPILPAVIPGAPPTEQSWLDMAAERLQRPIVRLFLPEVVDLHRPPEGAGRNFLFVSIRKEFPHQARKVMNALWGMTGFATTKWIIVVDADVDVRDASAVWFHVGANAHPGRDLQSCDGPTYDADHAAPVPGMGQKLGVDATRKLPAEGHPREWPEPLEMSRQMRELVEGRWSEYGFGGEARR
ncbi:MAG: UbiD family decarboxylase domain-containing protein [Planctomycetaceae bacterium]